MIFQVQIDINEDGSCADCMFKEVAFDSSGFCRLFKEMLKAKMVYGTVEKFYACNTCRNSTIRRNPK